ncbi:MAG: uracil-DNA glycosylase [Flavobacteriaceae bacterium]|nr:uracil-DNA glycosylase [Flavobacteriaceae bacterium]
MIETITNSWKEKLQSEFDKDYFITLVDFIVTSYQNSKCYPIKKDVFNAFNQCSFENIKVVLIGQDPYHGKGQANGLCFSVHNGIKHPPSLVNILKELIVNYDCLYPATGDLTAWAKQGVLLLNATLTVEESKAGSHQKQGWETFTDAVIKKISDEKEDVVFLLWGGYARKKVKLIDESKHFVLETGHPSPLSANRGYWFGNEHFLKTNVYLKSKNKPEINWLL